MQKQKLINNIMIKKKSIKTPAPKKLPKGKVKC